MEGEGSAKGGKATGGRSASAETTGNDAAYARWGLCRWGTGTGDHCRFEAMSGPLSTRTHSGQGRQIDHECSKMERAAGHHGVSSCDVGGCNRLLLGRYGRIRVSDARLYDVRHMTRLFSSRPTVNSCKIKLARMRRHVFEG